MTSCRVNGAGKHFRPLEWRERGYYAAFGLYIFSTYIEHVNFGEVAFSFLSGLLDFVRALIIGYLLVTFFIVARNDLKRCGSSALLLVAAFLTWIIGGTSHFFWLTLFVVSAPSVRLSKVSKIVLATSCVAIMITVVLFITGVVKEPQLVDSAGQVVHSLGFGHPNTLSLMLFVVALSCATLQAGNLPIATTLACLVAYIVSEHVSGSRTYGLMSLGLLLLSYFAYLEKQDMRLSKVLRCLRPLMPTVVTAALISLALFTMYCMANFNFTDDFFVALDGVLSTRLRLMNSYFFEKPFSLFGSSFDWMEPRQISGELKVFVCDNAYAFAYLRFGFVGFSLILGSMLSFLRRCRIEKYYGPILEGLLLFVVIAFVEGSAYQIALNPFALCMSVLITGEQIAGVDDISNYGKCKTASISKTGGACE